MFFFIRGLIWTYFPDAETRALLEQEEQVDPIRERVREAETWLNEHPDEVAQMERCGYQITRDPEFGLQYRAPDGGRGVTLTGLLEVWECTDKTTGRVDRRELIRRSEERWRKIRQAPQ